jgi:penicillin-binding protein 1C
MPLLANIPSDSERVFWFIGDSFIGSAPRGKAFFWKLEPGDHLLRAVDDRGRASTLNFSVMAGSP